MLAPPDHPRAVHDRMESIDLETGRAGQDGAIAISGYLGTKRRSDVDGRARPIGLVIAFAIAALVSAVQIYWMTRSDRIPTRSIYLSAASTPVLIGVISRIVGPFIIAPTLVGPTMLMAYAVHPRFGAMPIVAALLTAGVAIPWGLETAPASSPDLPLRRRRDRPDLARDRVHPFRSSGVRGDARAARRDRRGAPRWRAPAQATQIELQAWHLRQVVPMRRR
jgi:hypothetical protein